MAFWIRSSVRVSTELVAVEDEHAAVGQDGARDGQQLALALADVAGVLVDLGVVALRQRLDEVVDVGRLRRRLHLLVGGVQLAVADVVANGAVEQPRVLQHHAEQAAQIVAREIADVRAADLDAARLHVLEAHEQLDPGGLAGARGADQRDGLAFRHLGREVIYNMLISLVA